MDCKHEFTRKVDVDLHMHRTGGTDLRSVCALCGLSEGMFNYLKPPTVGDLIRRLRESHGEYDQEAADVLERFQWQDISTAPKDGTIIDIWHKSAGRVIDSWWCDDNTFCGLDQEEFSHWMPLPTPPETE